MTSIRPSSNLRSGLPCQLTALYGGSSSESGDGRTRAYAYVSYSACRHERQVSRQGDRKRQDPHSTLTGRCAYENRTFGAMQLERRAATKAASNRQRGVMYNRYAVGLVAVKSSYL